MAPPPKKRRSFARPLADLISGTLDPLLAKQGFGAADIVLNWDEIAGARLAAVTEPVKLQWPSRGQMRSPDKPTEPATLILRVVGAFALEVQHLSPVLCERVNMHLGWRCIGKIAIRQGPLERLRKAPRPKLKIDPAAVREAEAMHEGILDEGLRDALNRLGSRVISSARAKS
jgi:hypothetical protein